MRLSEPEVVRRERPRTNTSGVRPSRCAARVLVVDDEAGWANFAAHGLRRHGHAIVVADSVERALFLANVQRFDLLVTNLALVDGSGLTLYKKLRETNPDLRAVAISDADADQTVVSDAGFSFYLKKPVPIAALLRAVSTLF